MEKNKKKHLLENNKEIKDQETSLIQDNNQYIYINKEQVESNPLIYNYYFGQYTEKFDNSSKNFHFFNNFLYNSQQHYAFSCSHFNYHQNSCRFFIIKSSNEDNIHKVKFDLIQFSQLNIEYGVVQ